MINILQGQKTVSMMELNDIGEKELRRYVMMDIAQCMTNKLIPLMKINEEDNIHNFSKTITASVVVGDITEQDKFNKAVEARANKLTEEKISQILDKAISKIQIWRSYYGDTHIRKDEVIRFLGESIRENKT